MQIFLMGFMGSGKSTIGKILADKLNYEFLDLDAQIEKNEKRSIEKIFQTEGEAYFRKVEAKALNNLKKRKNRVVSLGGGTPCYSNNMFIISKLGTPVYIQTSQDRLVQNLSKDQNKRPLLKGLNKVRLKTKIGSMLRARTSFYNKANYKIRNNASPERIAERIRNKLDLD